MSADWPNPFSAPLELRLNDSGRACAAARSVARSPDDKHHGVTLGAYRRAKGMPWVPGAELSAWLACARSCSATGSETWPHAYFISPIGAGTGAEGGSIHCPQCRAELAAIRAGVVSAGATRTEAPKINKPAAFVPSSATPF